MKWYVVTKRIRGRSYLYWQKTYRVGRSTKTLNKYIGPTGSGRAVAPPQGIDPSNCRDCIMGRREYETAYCPVHYSPRRDNATSIAQTGKPVTRHYSDLTTDEQKTLLKPLGRFPISMPSEPTGTKVLIRSTDLPNNYVVNTIKEATLPDGTTYRYVDIYPYPENCELCGKPNPSRAESSACQSCRNNIPW